MPLALIVIGVTLIITSVKGDASKLYALIAHDFVGQGDSTGYIYWFIAIMIIGLVGYIKDFAPLSRAFMILVVLVLLLHNHGFFNEFFKQVLPDSNAA